MTRTADAVSSASVGVMPAWVSASTARSCWTSSTADNVMPGIRKQLGGEAATHLPGADEADPQGATCLVQPLLQPVSVAHVSPVRESRRGG